MERLRVSGGLLFATTTAGFFPYNGATLFQESTFRSEAKRMRISGGDARGITLSVPSGDAVRPATDGLRQAVFSSLALRIPGSQFVDLFAGSGAYGLEALSRGAGAGVFVERHARTAACLTRNLEAVAKSLKRPARSLARVAISDALTWSPAPGDPAPDLVFIDPPYDQILILAPALFARVEAWTQASVDPLIVFETPGEVVLAAAGWESVKRIGGKTAHQPGVSVFRRTPAGA